MFSTLSVVGFTSLLTLTSATGRSKACLECAGSCAILPPLGTNFPCYEGSPKNANFCYNTVTTSPSISSSILSRILSCQKMLLLIAEHAKPLATRIISKTIRFIKIWNSGLREDFITSQILKPQKLHLRSTLKHFALAVKNSPLVSTLLFPFPLSF